jgi:hypothetical protein
MVAFTAASVLTASALNSAFNAYTVNAQTGTTYTFVLTDQGGLVTASNASASTYTVPTNASVAYATGTRIELLNIGAGAVTLSPAGGVTLNGTTTVPQNGRVVLVKQATNTWYSNPLGGGGLTLITSATATAAATVSVNSCFTTAFDNYRILISGTSSADTFIQMRMRVSAADNTTANYLYGYVQGVSAAASSSSATGQTSMQVGSCNTEGFHYSIDIFSPAVAAATRLQSIGGKNTTTPFWISYYAVHNVTTAFDGFTFFPASGTLTTATNGIRVYGYSN